MDDIRWLTLISRWVHVGAAIVFIGGAAFLRFVMMPGAKRTMDEEISERLPEDEGRRWGRIVHVCTAVLLVTGTISFLSLAVIPKIDPLPYHPVFTVKLLASLAVFFIACALAGRGNSFAKMRRESARWLTALLALAALIVLLSCALGQIR